MEINTRKYKLSLQRLISNGIRISGETKIYSLLDAFSVEKDGFDIEYNNISTDDIKIMSRPNFIERVKDFLLFLNIQDDITKNRLVEEAEYYIDSCQYPCMLNDNFVIYKFFDGIRIINTGDVNGVVEYRISDMTTGLDDRPFQESGTFLGLNQLDHYLVEIRDSLNHDCLKSKIIVPNELIASTTVPLPNKEVYLSIISEGTYNDTIFRHGLIKLNPEIAEGETVQVDYYAETDAYSNGESLITLTCKPYGTTTDITLLNMDENSLNAQGNFILNFGDEICYLTQATANMSGAYACATFDICGVDGLGTVNATIDSTACESFVEKSKSISTIGVWLSGTTYEISSSSSGKTGMFYFTEDIPSGEYIDINLSGLTTSTFDDATNINAFIHIYCKENPSSSFVEVISHNTSNPQPLNQTIRAEYQNSLCYNLVINAENPGTVSLSSLGINSLGYSSGINAIINEPHTDSISVIIPPNDVIVSICHQTGNNNSMCGYVNAETLYEQQYVDVTVDEYLSSGSFGGANLSIYCIPNESSTCNVLSNTSAVGGHSCSKQTTFRIYSGDVIKYCGNIDDDSTDVSSITLSSVEGGNGANATINAESEKNCDVIPSI